MRSEKSQTRNKIKREKISNQFQNLTEKFQKQRQNHDPNTHIHDSLLGTCTSIKNGGSNLVLWVQTSPLSERMWIWKWHPLASKILRLICSCCKEFWIWYTIYFKLFCVFNINWNNISTISYYRYLLTTAHSDIKKNVDIKFSDHDTFLQLPSSGTLQIERLDSQII